MRNSIESNQTLPTAPSRVLTRERCRSAQARSPVRCSLQRVRSAHTVGLASSSSTSCHDQGLNAVGTFPPPRVYVRNAVVRRLARSVAHPIVFSQTLAICDVPGHLGCVKTVGSSNTAVHVPPNPCLLKTASVHSIYFVTIAYGMKHMTPLPRTYRSVRQQGPSWDNNITDIAHPVSPR